MPFTRLNTRAVRAAAATVALALGVALTGCGRPAAVAPAGALARGRALLDAGNVPEARQAFRDALAMRPGMREAQLGVAATFEATEDYDSAAAIYRDLAAGRLSRQARRQLQGRFNLVARRARERSARLALANEAVLSAQPAQPNTFAVMPFRFLGADTATAPLERGMAQLLITDLGRISAIIVLERDRIQAMLDEIALSDSGRTDSTSRVRSGRLLRAEQIVQGSMFALPGRQDVQVDASVVRAATAAIAATGTAADRLDELFRLEKTILFQLVDALAIPVTPAERQAMTDRPTTSFAAFVAYSQGLLFEDQGRFGEAAGAYLSAVRLDPGFAQARAAADRAALLRAAQASSLSAVTRILDNPLQAAFVADNLNRVMPSGMDLVDRGLAPRETPPPNERDPLGDVGGGDRITPPTGYGAIIIRVRRP